jgi:predicted AAA+ superfamily ATPase
MEFERSMESLTREVASTFRAMVVSGPRQVGKTWLLRKVTKALGGYEELSFDDPALVEQARTDPGLFLQMHPGKLYLDEVQRVPELFPAMKRELDREDGTGRYLMTGNQQFPMSKGLGESLAGRVGVLRLNGLTKAEAEGRPGVGGYVPTMTARGGGAGGGVRELYAAVVKGGYPECHRRPEMNVRRYFASYIETYIERDVRDMVDISNVGTFRTFMRVCAARTGQLLNYADLARDSGVSVPTARKWLSMLETTGIVWLLHPYHNNLVKRAAKTPKLYFTDSGLCSHLLGVASAEAGLESAASGALLETFAVMEICKRHWYAGSDAHFWFFRDGEGREVDLLLEREGRLHPIEVKRATMVRERDVRPGMRAFRAAAGASAGTGAVLYGGETFGALDSQTVLVPIAKM